jgi:hypothetical protein
MFSKKARIIAGTTVLTVLAVAFTGVASARIGESRLTPRTGSFVSNRPMHDGDGPRDHREPPHLDAVTGALGLSADELQARLGAGSSLADIAAAEGVDVRKVVDAIVADEKAELAQRVDDGKLTQAEADAMLARVVEHATAIVNGEHLRRGFRDGHGPRGRMKRHLDVAASALGVTPEELKRSLEDGSSLADVATTEGVDVREVVDAIVADEKAEIAQRVDDGKLTQAEADAMLSRIVAHATAIVNGEHPGRADRHGHRRGDGPTGDRYSDA